jgi:hypothetical protein
MGFARCSVRPLLKDPRLELGDDAIRIHAAPGDSIEHVETWSLEIRHRDGWR